MGITSVTWACKPRDRDTAWRQKNDARGDVGRGSGFVGLRAFFDGHVLEFTGLKDFSAFQTLDVFGVLFAADNLHAGVLTRIHDPSL